MKKALFSIGVSTALLVLFYFLANEPVRYIPNTPGYVVTARNVPRVSTFSWWNVSVEGLANDLVWAFPDEATFEILGDANPVVQRCWSAKVIFANGEVVSLLLLADQSWVVVNEANYPTTKQDAVVGKVFWREQ